MSLALKRMLPATKTLLTKSKRCGVTRAGELIINSRNFLILEH